MTTKLTLTMDDEVIKKAKSYAQKKGRSLSGLVENYLQALSALDNPKASLSPRVQKLKGAISLPENFDYKDALEKALIEKYGK